MGKWLQRVRGALGLGIIWATVCGAVGVLPRWVFGIRTDVPIPIVAAVFGFLAGVTFSGVLALAARRRTFEQLSLPRFAAWGATGGVFASVLFAQVTSLGWGALPAIAPIFALASAVCASGTLILARRAGRGQSPALSTDAEESELFEQGNRKLPRRGD